MGWPADFSSKLRPLQGVAKKIIPPVVVIGLLAMGWLAIHELNSETKADSSSSMETANGEESESSVIALPEAKVRTGKISAEPIEEQYIQHVHIVPGRIRYDDLRHVDIKAPVDGVLIQLHVKPGEHVTRGQLLAVLNSPTVGEARSTVVRREADLLLAKRSFDRASSISQNLNRYLEAIDAGKDLDSLEDQFSELVMGNYRRQIVSAYSRLLLAKELSDNVQPLAETGSIAGRTIRERSAEVEIARAEYLSARDQAAFEAAQVELEAKANLEQAQRQLNIAHEALEALLGYPDSGDLEQVSSILSRLEVRAPFAGTVESRFVAENERVARSESLLVLADTRSLYVAADIRENDWAAITLEPGEILTVSIPAIPDATFQARLHYVGREVAVDSNAVSLVATIDNAQGLLRPGMFVHVEIPLGDESRALAVSPESIVHHDDQSFVFVELADNRFQKINVSTGKTSDQWVEVTYGLAPGQLVVNQGAFLLKSEMLLEGEVE